MYKGFKLNSQLLEMLEKRYNLEGCYSREMQIYEDAKDMTITSFCSAVDSFIKLDGAIDASRMQEDWFPQVKADIFISHSHQDEYYAIALAGLIREKTRLRPFVDSCVWGYANELLEWIDDTYCIDEESGTYDYASHNAAASHIHTMLTTALDMMIYKTECFFFLDTENSTQLGYIDDQETASPWIYHELIMSRLLFSPPKRPIEQTKFFDTSSKLPPFNFAVTTGHLKELSYEDFCNWINRSDERNKTNSTSMCRLREQGFPDSLLKYINRGRCLDMLYGFHN